MKWLKLLLLLVLSFQAMSQRWEHYGKLSPDSENDLTFAGVSVSISGDYAAMGSENDTSDSREASAGAVYIFKREGMKWSLCQKIQPPKFANTFSEFGKSVKIQGNTLVITDPVEPLDEFGTNYRSSQGAVYIYELNGDSVWIKNSNAFIRTQAGQVPFR